MIEERRAFLRHDVHETGDAKHLIRFGGPGSSRDHQLAWMIPFDDMQDGAQGIRLRHPRCIRWRRPRVVGLDGDQLVADRRFKAEAIERLSNRDFNLTILGNRDGDHVVYA